MVCEDKKCLYHKNSEKVRKAYENLDDVVMDEVMKN